MFERTFGSPRSLYIGHLDGSGPTGSGKFRKDDDRPQREGQCFEETKKVNEDIGTGLLALELTTKGMKHYKDCYPKGWIHGESQV
jgi:hypothetical protein